MTKTTNLELYKPDGTDFYNIELQNENMDILDAEIKKSTDHIADDVSHITSMERTSWNAKLDNTATAANADKVDGYHASDFVRLTNFSGGNLGSLAKYYTATVAKDCNDIDEFLAIGIGADGLHYPVANAFFYIMTLKYNDGSKKQIALDYGADKMYVRFLKNGVWNDWKAVALMNEVLPLSGGTIKGAAATNLHLVSTGSETSCISFKGVSGNVGYLGMKGPVPVYIAENNAVNNLLHSGNSKPVVISETAPTDTTALWIW